jgi:hypothetical protein
MHERTIADILSAQADRLIEGHHGEAAFDCRGIQRMESLVPLMELAERVESSLRPVEPSPVFVQSLSRQLSAKWVRGNREMNRRARSATFVVAAALGSAVSVISAVGIVVYLIRHRERRAVAHYPDA